MGIAELHPSYKGGFVRMTDSYTANRPPAPIAVAHCATGVFAIVSRYSAREAYLMPATSLEAKKAYFAKVRRSNYVASLRLEGFDVTPADADRKLPTREAALDAHRNKQG